MDVEVQCICPVPTTHRDTITLRDTLDFRGAMACRQAVRLLKMEDPESSSGDFLAVLSEHYLIHGIESWTLVDGKDPLPVSGKTIRERVFPYFEVAMTLADAADELYTETVLLPLLGLAPSSLPTSPTDESTSPTTTTPSKPTSLRPSKRSLTTTSPTAVIETTSKSPDGDYSSSQSSTSAA